MHNYKVIQNDKRVGIIVLSTDEFFNKDDFLDIIHGGFEDNEMEYVDDIIIFCGPLVTGSCITRIIRILANELHSFPTVKRVRFELFVKKVVKDINTRIELESWRYRKKAAEKLISFRNLDKIVSVSESKNFDALVDSDKAGIMFRITANENGALIVTTCRKIGAS